VLPGACDRAVGGARFPPVANVPPPPSRAQNSLVQALFFVEPLRNAIFSWRYDPSLHGDSLEHCIPAQLQVLFARLALSVAPFVGTASLTTAFGWEGEDAFLQHDVQELCRVLFEALSWADSAPDGLAALLPALFGGSLLDVLTCTSCGHSRTKTEGWQDLSLPVAGMEPGRAAVKVAIAPADSAPTVTVPVAAQPPGPCTPYTGLHTALRSLSAVEVLEGSNAWACEGCGGPSPHATKRVQLAVPLPPVLTLHLRRFGLDMATGRYTKVVDPFSFPVLLPARAFTACEGGEGEGEGEVHVLSAVLLHAGGASRGHYFAFVRVQGEACADEGSAEWLLANDVGMSRHTCSQMAHAVGAALDSEAAGGGAVAAYPPPAVPANATPYLLLYTRREVAGAVRTEGAPPLGLAVGEGEALARQYAHAAALGAGRLPHELLTQLHAENSAWAELARAAAIAPHITTLQVYSPWSGAEEGGMRLRRTGPAQAGIVSTAPTRVFVASDAILEEATAAAAAACGLSGSAVRLRRFDPSSRQAGEPIASYASVSAAGCSPSACVLLEVLPADGMWAPWSAAALTLRLLPWSAAMRARCSPSTGASAAAEAARWADVPMLPTLPSLDGHAAECPVVSTLVTIATTTPSAPDLSALLPPSTGSTAGHWGVVVPGGLPEADEVLNGRAAARLRARTGSSGPGGAAGPLKVIPLTGPGCEGGLARAFGVCDGDDVVVVSDESALPAAVSLLQTLFLTTALRLDVRCSPALEGAMEAEGGAAALAAALHAWASARDGSVVGGPEPGPVAWHPSGFEGSPHALYCGPTSSRRAPLQLVSTKEAQLGVTTARALALALGCTLTLPTGGASPREGAAPLQPLPLHLRRGGGRAGAFRTCEGEQEGGPRLSELDIGDGAALALCLGPPMPSGSVVVRVWAWAPEAGGGSGALVLITSVVAPLTARLASLKKGVHAALSAAGVLPSNGTLTPAHLRLRTRGQGGTESILLRDTAVLRSCLPLPPAAANAAVLAHMGGASANAAGGLSLSLPSLSPMHLCTSEDDRDVMIQVLPSPEVIGREDLLLRVRRLRSAGETGSEAVLDAAEEVVVARTATPASLAAALALGAGLTGSGSVRFARVSAHGPGVGVYDALRTVSWSASVESGEGWAAGALAGPPLSVTDGCTLLWRADGGKGKENEAGAAAVAPKRAAGSGAAAVAAARRASEASEGEAPAGPAAKPWLLARAKGKKGSEGADAPVVALLPGGPAPGESAEREQRPTAAAAVPAPPAEAGVKIRVAGRD